MSRSESAASLKKNLEIVAAALQKALDDGQEVLTQNVEGATPDSAEGFSALVKKLRGAVNQVSTFSDNFNTLYFEYKTFLRAKAESDGKTAEEADEILNEAVEFGSKLVIKAIGVKAALQGARSDAEQDKRQLSLDQLAKTESVATEKRRREEEATIKLTQEAELLALKEKLEHEKRQREQALALSEKQALAQMEFEKLEREAKIENERRALDFQEAQAADKQKLELEKLELVRSSGVAPDAVASLFSQPGAGATTQRYGGVNRPKLKLKEFHGDPLAYTAFMQSFMNSIGLDDQTPDVMKHNHLRTLLKGEADRLVGAISITAENYPLVLKKLEDRFWKPDVVKKTLLDSIFDMDKRSWQDTSSDMHLFYETFNTSLCRLEALGQNVDNEISICAFLSRITPYAVNKELNSLMKLRQLKEMTLKSYRELFEEFLIDRDKLDHQSSTLNPHFDSSGSHGSGWEKGGDSHSGLGSGSTLATGTREITRKPPPKPKVPCIFCGDKRHFSDQCRVHSDIQSRKKKLREKGRCLLCALPQHRGPCQKRLCFHCKKQVNHNRALCMDKFPAVPVEAGTPTVGHSTTSVKMKSGSRNPSGRPTDVYLQTALTEVRSGKKGGIQCRVLLDSCSDRSYISGDVAQKLRLKCLSKQQLAIYKLRSEEPDDVSSSTVRFDLKLVDGSYMSIIANTVTPVTGRVLRYSVNSEVMKSLTGLTLSDSLPEEGHEWSHVDLLIGGDYYHEIMSGQKRCLDGEGLYLESSKLGEVLCGAIRGNGRQDGVSRSMLTISHSMDAHLPFSAVLQNSKSGSNQLFSGPDKSQDPFLNLEDFWKLESIGIDGSPEVSEDDKALAFFEQTVQYDPEQKRYFVKWPVKEDLSELPDNYLLALGRLKSLLKKLLSDPKGEELVIQYDGVIVDQNVKNIIEEVTELTPQFEVVHYIPHHAVIKENENATTKIRIVYDGSARRGKGQKSLNDLLLRGAVMLLDQIGILLRIRLFLIALISDIEKAFLQVGLQLPDRDVCRFLWLRDPKLGVTEGNLVIYRFTKVPFGVKPSPHLLAVTVAYHMRKNGSPTAMKILSNIYVDNVLTGVDSVEEGLEFYSEGKKIFQEASMNLREWTSNNKSLISQIPEVDRAKGRHVKILGLNWDTELDTLQVSGVQKLLATEVRTKRDLLHAVASVYDPLGFVSPVVIRLKILLQDLWRLQLSWDEPLSEEILQRWKDLSEDLHLLDSISIPRYVGSNLVHVESAPTSNPNSSELSYQLMCFTDSSKLAFSALTYLKVTDSSNRSSVSLLFSKSRLAPIKEITIPRLELLGVLIGARMLNTVQLEMRLTFGGIFMWTDSTCVMDWMSSKKPQPVFIERRLASIRNLMKKHNFEVNYVPTEENPADLATRGCSAMELRDCSLWWNGPSWLGQEPENWPSFKPCVSLKTLESLSEKTEEEPLYEVSLVSSSVGEGPPGVKDGPFGIKPSNFSKLPHLLRVTAWCLRFVLNIKAKACVTWKGVLKDLLESHIFSGKESAVKLSGLHQTPDLDDIEAARFLWLRSVQNSHFSDELKHLSGASKKTAGLVHQLGLCLDQTGLIRCHGRLGHSELTEGAKWPKLLPSKDPLTALIIQDCHLRLKHAGVTQTLAMLREEYWIPKGRQTVRSVLKGPRGCLVCRRVEGGAYSPPEMPALPLGRVTRGEVFSETGLDYLGPILVKRLKDRPEPFKVWVCLFTCTRVRALHLEIVEDMTAESFLNALRRFISLRGKPVKIISDNAGQFLLTQKMLEKHWKDRLETPSEVMSYCASEGIRWSFITPVAPWMGGFYERLVGSVKRSLRKSLGKRLVTFDQLHTLLKEIESVLNSRPLTVLGNDLEDHVSLTPNHFLMGHVQNGTPVFDTSGIDDRDYEPQRSSAKSLFDFWTFGQKALDQFWNLWKAEYLTSLRETQQSFLKTPRVKAKESPLVGEIVLIHEENQPRGSWKMGRIIELFPGADNLIRSAKVRLPDGTTLRRAVKNLYPLECQLEDDQEEAQPAGTEEESMKKKEEDDVREEGELVRKRPERRAKVEAQRRIEQLAQSDEEADQ